MFVQYNNNNNRLEGSSWAHHQPSTKNTIHFQNKWLWIKFNYILFLIFPMKWRRLEWKPKWKRMNKMKALAHSRPATQIRWFWSSSLWIRIHFVCCCSFWCPCLLQHNNLLFKIIVVAIACDSNRASRSFCELYAIEQPSVCVCVFNKYNIISSERTIKLTNTIYNPHQNVCCLFIPDAPGWHCLALVPSIQPSIRPSHLHTQNCFLPYQMGAIHRA